MAQFTGEAYGIKVTVSLENDHTATQAVDAFWSIMRGLGFYDSTISSAMISIVQSNGGKVNIDNVL
jgi:hypothetical protein